ncbi:MAG: carbohydrate ABC transporter permease [Clostridiales bacterium]|nr:carbohydrate ABC transporter permease [Clostridiales bacterium]MDY3748024.1 carbohydrate ABC transporter permease [Lachnospiraceae bacterium]
MKGNKWYGSIGRLIIFVIFCLFAIVIILPMIWMLVSSFKSNTEFLADPWGLPSVWKIENYAYAIKYGVGRYFINSVIVTIGSVFLTVFISALASYILSRFQFKGKNIIFLFILGGMMISPEVNLVSLFKILQTLELYDTYIGLIITYCVFQLSFTVLLMRSYMLSMSQEIEESAFLDGCSVFKVFLYIVVPICKPVIASGALFATMHAWNEYMFATVFIESDKLKTIPVGLVTLQSALKTDFPVLISGLVISAAVVIIAFFIFQKQFIRGLTQGSVKG